MFDIVPILSYPICYVVEKNQIRIENIFYPAIRSVQGRFFNESESTSFTSKFDTHYLFRYIELRKTIFGPRNSKGSGLN